MISLSTATTGAETTYYRWLDDRGNPVHSDRPPPKGVDYEVLRTGGKFKRVVSAEEGVVPATLEPSVSNSFEAAPIKIEDQIKKNPEVCDRARENLTAVESFEEVHMKDDQGNDKILSEDEKAAQRELALKQIRLHCN
ncbi:DUF4124 domain-containing protein [Parahaliea maris]|uniref:DUF4124 domain-containing protein n=1 Tax=Parahaliea maris TaxID=2716870 RepID=UPI00164EFC3D|nr:DUF4124 domain-containing protein [Parahaliea maris]